MPLTNRFERKLNRRPSGLHPEWVLGIAAAIIAAAIGTHWVEVASIRSEHGERLARVETQLEQIQTTQAQILTQVEQAAEKID